MQDQKQNNNKNKLFRKSQLLLLGSFLVFMGLFILSYHHLAFLKNQVFANMEISIADSLLVKDDVNDKEVEVPPLENVSDGTSYEQPSQVIDYSKYLGVLEIPKISLKRGFYNTDSRYNSIEYNVTLVPGSTMPDVVNGNLILMAHSGDAYISFFAYLYRLNIGDSVYVLYQGHKYRYQLVNVYTVPKTGKAPIYRNYNRTTLTLITCTKNDDTTQTVYIAELVS